MGAALRARPRPIWPESKFLNFNFSASRRLRMGVELSRPFYDLRRLALGTGFLEGTCYPQPIFGATRMEFSRPATNRCLVSLLGSSRTAILCQGLYRASPAPVKGVERCDRRCRRIGVE